MHFQKTNFLKLYAKIKALKIHKCKYSPELQINNFSN